MARFFGKVGYGQTVNAGNGVHRLVITERNYGGDVIRDTRRLDSGDKVNDDISVGNSISIVSDDYANSHLSAIRYVEFSGALWKVTEVETQSPRLLLRLGGVYNGPTPEPPVGP